MVSSSKLVAVQGGQKTGVSEEQDLDTSMSTLEDIKGVTGIR